MEIKRDSYLRKLINRQHNGLVKVITGIRCCGKSYLLFELFYKYLKEQGVDDKAVRYILTNRVYIGEYNHYGKRKIIDTFINAIYVSDDDFKKCI